MIDEKNISLSKVRPDLANIATSDWSPLSAGAPEVVKIQDAKNTNFITRRRAVETKDVFA